MFGLRSAMRDLIVFIDILSLFDFFSARRLLHFELSLTKLLNLFFTSKYTCSFFLKLIGNLASTSNTLFSFLLIFPFNRFAKIL